MFLSFFLFLGSLSYFSTSVDDAILYVRKAFAYAILKLPYVGGHAPAAEDPWSREDHELEYITSHASMLGSARLPSVSDRSKKAHRKAAISCLVLPRHCPVNHCNWEIKEGKVFRHSAACDLC